MIDEDQEKSDVDYQKTFAYTSCECRNNWVRRVVLKEHCPYCGTIREGDVTIFARQGSQCPIFNRHLKDRNITQFISY